LFKYHKDQEHVTMQQNLTTSINTSSLNMPIS